MKAPDAELQSLHLRAGPSALRRYLFALIATLIAFLIRYELDSFIHQYSTNKHIFVTFVIATTVVAWYSGFVPSLLTFVAGFVLADLFFMDPHHAFAMTPNDFVQTVVPPVVVCGTIILFGRYMHFARDKAHALAREAIEHRKKLEVEVLERTRVEEEVRRLNAELEQRVQLRTAELVVSNQELESFSYSVSHDLRAPLRHVDGYAQMLVEQFGPELSEDALKLAAKIRQGSQNMGRLVDDLLNLSRLGKQPLTLRHVALTGLLTEAMGELKPEIGERRVEWKIGTLPTVEGDPGLLRLVFVNLLSNAVKYTRPREVTSIEIGQIESDGEKPLFIRDNGVGFNMKYSDKLFGVFQRLHRADDFEGTGVGLATVARIIRRHGGRIWADAEVNKGATFYFTLPPSSQKPMHDASGDPPSVPTAGLEPISA